MKALIDDTLGAILTKRRARKRLPEPRLRRLLRERAGLTQQDIAGVLGVDRATLSRWESGERDPWPSHVGAYVETLDRLAREG